MLSDLPPGIQSQLEQGFESYVFGGVPLSRAFRFNRRKILSQHRDDCLFNAFHRARVINYDFHDCHAIELVNGLLSGLPDDKYYADVDVIRHVNAAVRAMDLLGCRLKSDTVRRIIKREAKLHGIQQSKPVPSEPLQPVYGCKVIRTKQGKADERRNQIQSTDHLVNTSGQQLHHHTG